MRAAARRAGSRAEPHTLQPWSWANTKGEGARSHSTANEIKVGKYISLDPCALIRKTTFVVCSSALKKKRQCKSGLRSTWRILPVVLLSPCMSIILLRSKQTQSQCYQQNIATRTSSDACSFLKTRLWCWVQPRKSWKKIWPRTFHLLY